ncbi:PduL/EutD family phosphate acyltransferase, partial [Streptococcus suis]
HMTPEDAAKANVVNKEIVQVKVGGERGLIFDDVVIRVHPKFATFMHIDYDEANACGFKKGMRGRIIKKR